MSEFPFPPERHWTQYADGPAAGPKPPAPITGDSHRIFAGSHVPSAHQQPPDATPPGPAAGESGPPQLLSQQLSELNLKTMQSFLSIITETLRNPNSGGGGGEGAATAAAPPGQPSAGTQKGLEDVQLHLLSMHKLLNTYRPHEARRFLAGMLEGQLGRRETAVAEVAEELQALGGQLAGSLKTEPAAAAAAAAGGGKPARARSRSPAPGGGKPARARSRSPAPSGERPGKRHQPASGRG